MNQTELLKKYKECIKQEDAEAAGNLVVDLDDETCKQLYEVLAKDPETASHLVRPLWYNYRTQKMRW